MPDTIVIRWMNEGWVLRANDVDLRPKANSRFPGIPLVFSRGQADAYLLASPVGGKSWILKKFHPTRLPSASYLSAIKSLVPAVRGTESATSRYVLSSASLQSLIGAGVDATRELALWLDSTVLMARVLGEGWGDIAGDLSDGRIVLAGTERVQIAQSLCTIVESLEKANCAHRDLSSGNVFIELPSQRASLIDWDSVYHKSLPMPLNTTAGTLGYIAPFITRVGSDWDAAASWVEGADRFSLALLVTEMLITAVGTPLTDEGGIFDQDELCKRSGPRLNAVVSRVRSALPFVHQLLIQALQSTSFAGCPSPAEWTLALDKETKQNSAFVRFPRTAPTAPPSTIAPPAGTPRTNPVVMPVSRPSVAQPSAAPPRASRTPRPSPTPPQIAQSPGNAQTPLPFTIIGGIAGVAFAVVFGSAGMALLSALHFKDAGFDIGLLWLLASSICVGFLTTGAISGKRRRVVISRRALLTATALLCVLWLPFLRTHSAGNTVIEYVSSGLVVPPALAHERLTAKLLNASYPSACFQVFSDVGFGKMMSLHNGDWDNGQSDPVKHAYFGVINKKIIFTSLTRDGRREAVVPTACGIYASTEAYTEVFVIDTSSPALTVLARLSPEDWGDNSSGITYIWNTSDIRVKNGLLLVSFQLGGSHAQPDWDATSGFRWNGSRFVRIGFEAHGETAGSHPNEVIQEGADLHLSHPQQAGQNNVPSTPATGTFGEQPSLTSTTDTGTQEASRPSEQALTPVGRNGDSQAPATTQSPSASQALIVSQRLTLAESQFEHDDFAGALQRCDYVLQLDPQNANAIQLKERIENTMKILGISAPAKVPSGSQVSVQQWLTLAEGQFEHDDFKDALQSCNAALQIDPQNSRAILLKEKIAATMKVLGDSR
ncbi:MAG TPA: hypothetical protein VMA34_18625 [Terracidiphilus sp.]|nr:hypothetical protein [Terracidiphilus sp.]